MLPYTEVILIQTASTVQATSAASRNEGDFDNVSPLPSALNNHSTPKSCTTGATPPTQDVSSSLLEVIDEEEEIDLIDEPVARLDPDHRLNVTFTVGQKQTQNTNSVVESNAEETTHLDFTSQYNSLIENFLILEIFPIHEILKLFLLLYIL